MDYIGFTHDINDKIRCYGGENLNENDIITYVSDNKPWYSIIKSKSNTELKVVNLDLIKTKNNIIFKLNNIINTRTNNFVGFTSNRKIYKFNNILML